MTSRTHHYEITLEWQGNRGSGTSGYRDYGRAHEVRGVGKPPIAASSDPGFRGETDRWNPEELLVAALSQCHLLTYLHAAAVAGVVVTAYTDAAEGTMVEQAIANARRRELIGELGAARLRVQLADRNARVHGATVTRTTR